ncbi:MAG: tRNA dihydrouridine(20/20a) synthase DusA [Rhodospirillales bacterium]|nr:tRNA dihydrouridine(20/20a) synthase DusA [Alphaproteobacteria bacterium]USO03410.1 MAG: tRNA dihydrouridine(20/20a) synthase DusA [Rhodospirillales bacterium]
MKPLPQICVAPMMDWTDRHCRYFHRLIAPHVRLYTEMVTTGALLHGDRDRFLRFSEEEKPVVLQLGGSEASALASCAKMGEDYGYDEINLNCGCPSDRVQSGAFGACLMEEPARVGEIVSAMQGAVKIPVSVKCRVAIDEHEDYPFLETFIKAVSAAGCQNFVIHARKAWLKGLSPKENRDVPPLRYDVVEKIRQEFPSLHIVVNGGIRTVQDAAEKLALFDGIMIGREAYQNPFFLSEIERRFFKNENPLPRESVIEEMIRYAAAQQKAFGTPVKSVTRHMTGLFQGEKGARKWRQALSTLPHEDGAGPDVLRRALEATQNPLYCAIAS